MSKKKNLEENIKAERKGRQKWEGVRKEMKDLIEREVARIRRDIQENVDREIRKLREKERRNQWRLRKNWK